MVAALFLQDKPIVTSSEPYLDCLVQCFLLLSKTGKFTLESRQVSDAPGYLERTFLSHASVRARKLISKWMEDAGLTTWVDSMGNVHGRFGGMNPFSKALLIGSHLDTVIDAGKFDGSLGIVSALSALKVLHRLEKLRRPVEVTVKGSQGHAGTVPMSMRQDPLPAAAELIVLLESLCRYPENFISYSGQCDASVVESIKGSLVCTVGEIYLLALGILLKLAIPWYLS